MLFLHDLTNTCLKLSGFEYSVFRLWESYAKMWWQRLYSSASDLWSFGLLFFLCPPWLCPIPWRVMYMCVNTPVCTLWAQPTTAINNWILTYSLHLWSHSGSTVFPEVWILTAKSLQAIWGHLRKEFRDSKVQGNHKLNQKGSHRPWGTHLSVLIWHSKDWYENTSSDPEV